MPNRLAMFCKISAKPRVGHVQEPGIQAMISPGLRACRDIKQKAPQVPDWKEEKDAEPEPEHAELTLENIKEG